MELLRPVHVDANWILAAVALALVGTLAAVLDPRVIALLVVGALVLGALVKRPYLGVGTILAMLLVEYGERPGDVFGGFVPGGVGLLTINNMIGLFLAVLLAYRVYRERDWSFLRSRQVQLVLLISAILIVLALLSPIDRGQIESLGLKIEVQESGRKLMSRALFVLLFVAFVRRPRELRFLTGIFLIIALGSALIGFNTAMTGAGYRAAIATEGGYRAGGPAVLMEVARNPNRLALVCVLALVFVWEYGEIAAQRWRRLVAAGTSVMLVVTVFLTASRGGVAALVVTGLVLTTKQGQSVRRIATAALVVLLAGMVISETIPERTAERLEAIPGIARTSGEGEIGSYYRRRYNWYVALKISAAHPMFGVGLGNWGYERFMTDPLRIAAPPHNAYLLALAEGGIVTLSLYLVLFWITLRQLRDLEQDPQVMQRAREDRLEWVIRGTRRAVISYMIFSVFGDIWVLPIFYLLVALSGALIVEYGAGRLHDTMSLSEHATH